MHSDRPTAPPSDGPHAPAPLAIETIDYMMTHMSLADVLATVAAHLAPISQDDEPWHTPSGRYSSCWRS